MEQGKIAGIVNGENSGDSGEYRGIAELRGISGDSEVIAGVNLKF